MPQEPSRRLRELRGVGEEAERGDSAAAATTTTTAAAAEHRARSRASGARRRRHVPDLPQDQVRGRRRQPVSLLRTAVMLALRQQGGAALRQGRYNYDLSGVTVWTEKWG